MAGGHFCTCLWGLGQGFPARRLLSPSPSDQPTESPCLVVSCASGRFHPWQGQCLGASVTCPRAAIASSGSLEFGGGALRTFPEAPGPSDDLHLQSRGSECPPTAVLFATVCGAFLAGVPQLGQAMGRHGGPQASQSSARGAHCSLLGVMAKATQQGSDGSGLAVSCPSEHKAFHPGPAASLVPFQATGQDVGCARASPKGQRGG